MQTERREQGGPEPGKREDRMELQGDIEGWGHESEVVTR